jgi:hypothetical protein
MNGILKVFGDGSENVVGVGCEVEEDPEDAAVLEVPCDGWSRMP